MKKLGISLLVLVLVLSLGCAALAEDYEIEVSGSAQVGVAADFATLTVGVETIADSVASAQSENAQIMADVIRTLQESGIADKDLKTQYFSVNNWRRDDGQFEYHVNNSLQITIRDMNEIGRILDAATMAGANTVGGLSFDSTARQEAYQKALTRAVEDAQSKAQVLAAAAGKQLGELREIRSGDNYSYAGASNYYRVEASMDTATAILSGDISVSASVTLVYSFK